MDETRSVVEDACYLAGLFDGEGHVYWHPKGGPRRIAIANTDESILKAARACLDTLNIQYNTYKKYKTIPPNHVQCYELTIYGRENLEMFNEFVPFKCEKKRVKLQKMLAGYKRKTRRKEIGCS